MNNAALLSQLPAECQALSIEPRHKVALDHFLLVDGTVWVVLMPTKYISICAFVPLFILY